MFNSEEQQQGLSTMDARISFSKDFADTHQGIIKYESSYREGPVSSDFEFCVKNYAMIPADEIFFKGMLLPSKGDNGTDQQRRRKLTLRDTLLADDDNNDFEDSLPRLQKGSGWWKERLGLKMSNVVSYKGDRTDPILEKVVEDKTPSFCPR